MSKLLDYTYLRSEKSGKYSLFLKVEPTLLEKELDITINELKQLVIDVKDHESFVSEQLRDEIYHVLNNQEVFTLFVDKDANILASHHLSLMKKQKKVKP